MRTTIRIDDALYRNVKARAAASGRTVAAVLEDAVRRGLVASDAAAPAEPFRVVAEGHGGLRPGVDLTSNAAMQELFDEGRSVDELR